MYVSLSDSDNCKLHRNMKEGIYCLYKEKSANYVLKPIKSPPI